MWKRLVRLLVNRSPVESRWIYQVQPDGEASWLLAMPELQWQPPFQGNLDIFAVDHAASLRVLKGPAGTVRELVKVTDPETYSALVYSPPSERNSLPLLVVLPGAGRNDKDAWDLANLKGEHGGLIPSLIASGQAPKELTENFCVVAPYAAGKKSFYEEPRKKMLAFIEWFCRSSPVDTSRIFLFGFSDGATEVMELASTRRFAGCIVCSYGFTGDLPALACERLKNIPVWVFHCADDVIFPVKCSDKLVKRLKEVNSRDVVRYSRFDKDQEGFTGSVRGHSSGITASRSAEIYSWLLALPKLQA